jgi:hypothetical protein
MMSTYWSTFCVIEYADMEGVEIYKLDHALRPNGCRFWCASCVGKHSRDACPVTCTYLSESGSRHVETDSFATWAYV